MLIGEINLPANSAIYEPKIENYSELKFEEIKHQILNSTLPNEISKLPTLVIINDAHRATPSNKILNILLTNVKNHQIKAIAIATGTHTAPSENELKSLLPKSSLLEDIEIIIHDSRSSDLIRLGKTSRGTEILINPIIKKYDQVLCINSVEPHYFAGFTGGVKSILPGLAGIATVEKNHSWALDPQSGPTKIEDNPLQLDLKEALTYIDNKLLGVQMVSIGSKIYDVNLGGLMDAFDNARSKAFEMFCIKIDKPVDLVLSVVYPPLDRSLYQSQKGIENTRQILKPGGQMILITNSPNGIGNSAFYDIILKYDTPSKVVESITQKEYNFGDHKAFKFASMKLESELFIVGNLTEKECKNVFAEKLDINHLEEHLRKESNSGKSIAVVLDSGILVMTL